MKTGLTATVKAKNPWNDTRNMLSNNKCPLRILYPAKPVFKNQTLQTDKLYTIQNTLAGKETLKGMLQAKGNQLREKA